MMSYFSNDFNIFFKELEDNNKREWFHANKKIYENHVKEPFQDFVQEMIYKIGGVDNSIDFPVKDAIFRINRDLRFTKDKTPYKTYVSAAITPGGKKNKHIPGFYFRLGYNHLGIFGGLHNPDGKTLANVRRHILKDPSSLDDILDNKDFKRIYGSIQGEKNKRLTAEFAEAAKQEPIIFNKEFYYAKDYNSSSIITRKDLSDFVFDHYLVGKPFSDYFRKAIK